MYDLLFRGIYVKTIQIIYNKIRTWEQTSIWSIEEQKVGVK